MDKEMMDRLIAIQMKHNPQTRIGAAIVVTELLTALREPTQDVLSAGIRAGVDIGFGVGYPDYETIYKAMIDSITAPAEIKTGYAVGNEFPNGEIND